MSWKQTIEAMELLDSATVTGEEIAEVLRSRGLESITVSSVTGQGGETDFLQISVAGAIGHRSEGKAPTLGIIGRLGGIGARPALIGMVSDADGAVAAVACALKLADMRRNGDQLPGDVTISTHICPSAPVIPHDPVPFVGSPVDMLTMNHNEVSSDMDAILSIDTTRGNWVVNRRGFAITPTIKEGYILKVSTDLLNIMSAVTGRSPLVLPITTQDITPYGNDIEHINSIAQPATATNVPVVGVALTSEVAVPGCATGANQATDVEMAVRFCIEVAKAFGQGMCAFFDPEEFARLVARYGPMNHLQTMGRAIDQ
jgi:hypothetical protein